MDVRAQARQGVLARQVLLDPRERNDSNEPILPNTSKVDLLKQANAALQTAAVGPGIESGKFKFISAARLGNGGTVLETNSAEAAAWVNSPQNRERFAATLDSDVVVKSRTYTCLMKFVPCNFGADSPAALFEVEETNGLEVGAIARARWLKAPGKRAPTQTVAHLVLTFNTPEAANKTLVEGLTVHQNRVNGEKLKKEALRCLRCQEHGHLVRQCPGERDICSYCGGEHRATHCTNPDKTYCVECQTDDHSSADRKCPTFIRRCAELDNRLKENAMPYFPTAEPWTQVLSPLPPIQTQPAVRWQDRVRKPADPAGRQTQLSEFTAAPPRRPRREPASGSNTNPPSDDLHRIRHTPPHLHAPLPPRSHNRYGTLPPDITQSSSRDTSVTPSESLTDAFGPSTSNGGWAT